MIEAAVAAVRAGLIVGLPTDTIYGIGVDPQNDEAVARLFELKGRPTGKPVGVLVASRDQAAELGELSGPARALADRHWPGGLTLIVRPRVVLAEWVGDRQAETVGLRMPDHDVALELLRETGPLAVTSANLSGGEETTDDIAARAVLGEAVAIYLPGQSPGGQASTVIDATGSEPVVLRKGPVHIR